MCDLLDHLFQRPQLKRLHLEDCYHPKRWYYTSLSASPLTSLTLTHVHASTTLPWLFTSRGPLFDHLKTLDIERCCNLREEGAVYFSGPAEASLSHFRSLAHLTLTDTSIVAAGLLPHLASIQSLLTLEVTSQSRDAIAVKRYALGLPAAELLSGALTANPNLTFRLRDPDPAAVARYVALAPRTTVEVVPGKA
jgi:hypothetical protein